MKLFMCTEANTCNDLSQFGIKVSFAPLESYR